MIPFLTGFANSAQAIVFTSISTMYLRSARFDPKIRKMFPSKIALFRPRLLHANQGMTLVELMVSVALFGVLSLGIAEMFAQSSKMTARAQNGARLSEQITQFSQILENYLSNTTQLIACNCANGCVLPDLTSLTALPAGTDCMSGNCGAGSTSTPGDDILFFEYEDANNPTVPANNTACVVNFPPSGWLSAAITPDQLTWRGCKKRIHLTAVMPTANSGSDPGSPGQLAIYPDDGSGNPLPPAIAVLGGTNGTVNSGKMTGTSGVYQMICGQTPIPSDGMAAATTPEPNHFRIELSVVSRVNNTQDTTSPQFEGWTTTSTHFGNGLQRNLAFDYSFHNLNVPGVHFGKTVTSINCTADNGSAPDGNCCSGYMDAAGTCVPMANCLVSGTLSPDIWSHCCSHKIFSVTGACT